MIPLITRRNFPSVVKDGNEVNSKGREERDSPSVSLSVDWKLERSQLIQAVLFFSLAHPPFFSFYFV